MVKEIPSDFFETVCKHFSAMQVPSAANQTSISVRVYRQFVIFLVLTFRDEGQRSPSVTIFDVKLPVKFLLY